MLKDKGAMPLRCCSRRIPTPSQAGFSFMEVIAAMTVAVLLGVVVIGGLITAQRYAAATRLSTNARLLLQRHLDTALNVKFTSASTPSILELTSGEKGEIYTELEQSIDGVTIPIAMDNHGGAFVSGTLWRKVVSEPNPVNADIRRVTFTIEYHFQGRDHSLSLSSIRSRDDQ